MAGVSRLYFREGKDALVVCDLDGLTLIYHRPSGITHIVDNPLPEVIGILGEEPRTAAEILARLAASYDFEGEAALDDLVRHLEELVALGLARAAP